MGMTKFSRGKATQHEHQFALRGDGSMACACGAVQPKAAP